VQIKSQTMYWTCKTFNPGGIWTPDLRLRRLLRWPLHKTLDSSSEARSQHVALTNKWSHCSAAPFSLFERENFLFERAIFFEREIFFFVRTRKTFILFERAILRTPFSLQKMFSGNFYLHMYVHTWGRWCGVNVWGIILFIVRNRRRRRR
jgi:hypothetical protein